MKILFVWPRSSTLLLRKPLTFSILAALTPKKHSVEIVEGNLGNINFNKKYDLVGITFTTLYAHLAYEIADKFRRYGMPVVLGGWHPSALPDEAKQHADSVVIGEAEETWPQLLRDAEIRKLKPFYISKQPVDPKLIPHPCNIYSKLAISGVQATRGCPYGCEFCAITNMKFRRVFRMREIDDVIEEIRSHPGKLFNFQDSSMTINVEYTKQLFRKIKGMNKRFYANGNVNTLGKDDELLKLASEAGCTRWYIGFESICQESIDSVGKKTNKVREYTSAIKKIHDHGMIIMGSFVFGFDYDTMDIFEKTDEFVRKNGVDVPSAHILTPYPGTPLCKRLNSEGRILTRDWSKYDLEHVVFQPKHMKPEELETKTYELHKKWFKTSNMVIRIMGSGKYGFRPFIDTTMANLYLKLGEF